MHGRTTTHCPNFCHSRRGLCVVYVWLGYWAPSVKGGGGGGQGVKSRQIWGFRNLSPEIHRKFKKRAAQRGGGGVGTPLIPPPCARPCKEKGTNPLGLSHCHVLSGRSPHDSEHWSKRDEVLTQSTMNVYIV